MANCSSRVVADIIIDSPKINHHRALTDGSTFFLTINEESQFLGIALPVKEC